MCSSRTLFLTLTVVATAHSALHYPPPLCCGWTTRGDEAAADLTKHDSDGAIFPFVLALRESEASIAHIKDVALAVSDPGSPTYGQHVSAVISAEEWNQILVPVGFAHGLVTLEPNTEVLYKVSNYYSPEHEKGILWNDPALEFEWPVDEAEALLSDKDKRQPRLADLPGNFHYETEMA